jgi:hypothetical protein
MLHRDTHCNILQSAKTVNPYLARRWAVIRYGQTWNSQSGTQWFDVQMDWILTAEG